MITKTNLKKSDGITKPNSTSDLYAMLKKNKLTKTDNIFDFCLNTDFSKVYDTVLEAFVLTDTISYKYNASLFNFSASITLSGGNYPCASLKCRLNKVEELALFSSLYSEHSVIYNPFDFVYFFDEKSSEGRFREEALLAFLITHKFKLLIERGLIVFSQPLKFYCAHCKKKKDEYLKSIEYDLLNISKEELYPLLLKRTQIEYGKGFFHLKGIEEIIGEDVYFHYDKFPKYLLRNGKRINDISKLSFNNQLIQMIVGRSIDSLMFQKFDYSGGITQTYLTSNLSESSLLDKLGKQSEKRAFNLFSKGLPVLGGLSFEHILNTREKYSESFEAFREHASELIEKARKFESQEEFNEYVGKELNDDLEDLKKIQKEVQKKYRIKGLIYGGFLGAEILFSTVTNSSIRDILSIAHVFYACKELSDDEKTLQEKIYKTPTFFYFKLLS